MMRLLPAFVALIIHVGITTSLILGVLKDYHPKVDLPEKMVLPARIWSFKTEAIDEMVDQLKAEREKIEEERKGLMAVQGRVDAEKAELEKVREDVKALREEVGKKIIEIEDNEMKNLKTLAQTYAAMAPGPAVAILREMEDNQAVKILALMKAEKVGPLLAEWVKGADRTGEDSMPKRAARISDKLRLMKPIKKST